MAATRFNRTLVLALHAGTLAALLGGCSGGAPQQAATSGTNAAERDPLAEAAARTEAMYKEMGKDAGATRIDRTARAPVSQARGRVFEAPPPTPTAPAALPLQQPEAGAESAQAAGAPLSANAPVEVPAGASPPPVEAGGKPAQPIAHPATADPASQRRALVHQLARSLASEPAESPEAMNTALALAALANVEPDAAQPALAAWQARLSSAQRAAFVALHDLYGKAPAAASADAGELAALLRDQAAALTQGGGLSIAHAALCRRVEGFGRYDALDTTTLVAGRAQPVIVYVEPEGFAHRAADTPDGAQRWTVELSQELQLYHDADGTLAWMDREQNISEASRRQRRDFYLVRRIDLPATLSIGAYRLKVVVRDRVSGTVAESIIPMQVVADANLAARPPQTP